jgi:hypothetical protein
VGDNLQSSAIIPLMRLISAGFATAAFVSFALKVRSFHSYQEQILTTFSRGQGRAGLLVLKKICGMISDEKVVSHVMVRQLVSGFSYIR